MKTFFNDMRINYYNNLVNVLKNYDFYAIPQILTEDLVDISEAVKGDVKIGRYDLTSDLSSLHEVTSIEEMKEPFKAVLDFNIKFVDNLVSAIKIVIVPKLDKDRLNYSVFDIYHVPMILKTEYENGYHMIRYSIKFDALNPVIFNNEKENNNGKK